MQFEILRKDKDIEANRMLKLIQHEKVIAEMNVKNEAKRFED